MEKWKFVNEKYEISDSGNLRRGKKMIKGSVKQSGYLEYTMSIDGKRIYALAHRLVAEAFIPNDSEKHEVNHIDCNRLNNNVENLEWCTHAENIQHSRRLNRYPKTIKKRSAETLRKDKEAKRGLMLGVIDDCGNIYETAKAAAYAHGLSRAAVRLAIKNGHKAANKHWRYLNN